MKFLTIGQLAKQAEVNIDTIRYYERRGLLSPQSRKESGYRQYLDDAVVRIRFIKHAKELGFSLDEIAELLSLRLDRAAKCGDVKKKAQQKIVEIGDKIQMLDRMRVTLEKLTKACDEGRQANECPILEALDMNNERGEMTSLIDRIGETVKGNITRVDLNPSEEAIRKVILRHFAAQGKAPSMAEIKAESGFEVDVIKHAIKKLEKNDIVLRRNGKIVSSYPFSALETRHRVIFEDGREVYALCSTDALGIHFMLEEAITVLSRCPESGKEIRIVLKNGRIESCEPQEAVEYISQGNGGCCTAETFCPNMNFFYSMEHLDKWKKKNPDQSNGAIYKPDETLKHGKDIFGGFLENVRNKETRPRLKGAICQTKTLRRR